MKRIFSILFALVLVLTMSLVLAVPVAATDVSGTIASSTTWSVAGSPYIVTADVTVNAGVTLTIDPGVTVKFNKGTSGPSLIINGNLVAEGTSGSNIVFTSSAGSPAANDWWRIQFNTGSTGSVKYCDIAYGTIPIYLNDVDGSAGNPAVTVENCNIHDGGSTGISLIRSDYNTVKDNTVTLVGIGQAIWLDTCSNNLIEGNTCTSATGGGTGIRLVGNFGDYSGNIVRANTCTGLSIGMSLESGATNNIIENNNCHDNVGNAFGIETGYGKTSSGNIIRGNTFSSAPGLLVMYVRNWQFPGEPWGTFSDIQITDNTITGQYGIRLLPDCNIDATQFTVNNNNLLGTTYGVKNNGAGTLNAENNWWGTAVESEIQALIVEQPGTIDYTPWLTGSVTQSVTTATGTGTASFSSDGGALGSEAAVAEGTLPTTGKPNLVFPHGFFSFTITGLTLSQIVTVTITLPSAVPVGTQYWKYGPTTAVPAGEWYQIVMGSDDGDNVITITLQDGGVGDDDLTADGTIVDQGGTGNPGAVGWETYPVSKVRVLLPWIALFAAIIAGASLLVLRRRRAQS